MTGEIVKRVGVKNTDDGCTAVIRTRVRIPSYISVFVRYPYLLPQLFLLYPRSFLTPQNRFATPYSYGEILLPAPKFIEKKSSGKVFILFCFVLFCFFLFVCGFFLCFFCFVLFLVPFMFLFFVFAFVLFCFSFLPKIQMTRAENL